MRVFLLLCFTFVSSATLSAQAARPKITGIAFMRVYTTDAAAADRFYGKTLGLSETRTAGTEQFVVNRHQWIEVLANSAPPNPTTRMAAIAFTTNSVSQMASYLASRAITAIDSSHAGELAVHDPEGNLVVFVQSGPSGPEAKAANEAALSASATSQRIIHVGFIVHNRAKEDAFWREVLGFRPYWYGGMTPAKTEWVSLQVPDGTDWLEYMLGGSATPDLRETGVLDHFSLGTASMNTVLAQLQKNGCEGKDCTAIQVGKDGKIQLNLFDPDQTRVEYMEFQPAMQPCCSPFTGPQPSELDPGQDR